MNDLLDRFPWRATLIGGLLVLLSPACRISRPPERAEGGITPENLLRHIRVLASDEFEGRAPGTRGEDLTVAYLTNEFQRMGLRPVGGAGNFVQHVPLAGSTSQDVAVTFQMPGRKMEPAFPAQCTIWSKRFVPEIRVEDSEIIFVGHGIVAPEYGWDDYKGVDVRGKTILMLINDPAIPDPANPTKLDETMFKGRAMTYYGRWTYKYEIAAEKGAAAAIIIHETGPAGYPWAVVQGSNSRENFDLQSPDKNIQRAAVEGWITLDTAKELLQASGQDFDQLKRAAINREFRPVPLGAKASFRFQNRLREVASQNVVAQVEGSDPKLKNECIIYSAHWDHLGRDPQLSGDQIFNGARDNASGVASLLELAGAFARMKTPPKRSVIFLAVTAEEKGLLGAKHYARHPLRPLAQTLANLNMDSMNTWGRTRDVTVVGLGQTTIEDVLREAAARRGRNLIPDAAPEKGLYFRSDHFEFARAGVPGLYIHGGTNFIGREANYSRRKSEDYVAHDYHKVSDEIKPDWDLSGAAEDTLLLFDVGRAIANGNTFPQWKAGSEFRKNREPR